jgi:sialic acid synthase SpsE
MTNTFVIAEAGSSHDNDLQKAFRLIEAAKECGADACKFQYWSSSKALADRRKIPLAEPIYAKYKLPEPWLEKLTAHCEKVGIEFMCTSYLFEDIGVIAPFVKRYKISAFEAKWYEFVRCHSSAIVSCNDHTTAFNVKSIGDNYQVLLCTSEYPTALEELNLRYLNSGRDDESPFDGLSDHTTSTLTGALAVAAGATIVEKHIRLDSTSLDNPDYGHSLIADYCFENSDDSHQFKDYVRNIREAERCM